MPWEDPTRRTGPGVVATGGSEPVDDACVYPETSAVTFWAGMVALS